MCVIMCAACKKIRESSKHHILPLRFYGSSQNSPILYLCRTCHDEIERLIPQHHKLDREDYFEIAAEFLQPAQQYGNVLPFVRRRKNR